MTHYINTRKNYVKFNVLLPSRSFLSAFCFGVISLWTLAQPLTPFPRHAIMNQAMRGGASGRRTREEERHEAVRQIQNRDGSLPRLPVLRLYAKQGVLQQIRAGQREHSPAFRARDRASLRRLSQRDDLRRFSSEGALSAPTPTRIASPHRPPSHRGTSRRAAPAP